MTFQQSKEKRHQCAFVTDGANCCREQVGRNGISDSEKDSMDECNAKAGFCITKRTTIREESRDNGWMDGYSHHLRSFIGYQAS